MPQKDDLDDDDDGSESSSTEDVSEESQDSLTMEDETAPSANTTTLSSYTGSGEGEGAIVKPPYVTGAHDKGNMMMGGMLLSQGFITPSEEEKKKEHKKRSKNWTRAETLKLIKARSELDERFRRSGRKVPLWDEIALALQRANFSRDGQQCKDKWEKLTAGYKEVRDGSREKEDHPFYEELHSLLSWKSYKRENEDGINVRREDTPGSSDGNNAKRVKFELGNDHNIHSRSQVGPSFAMNNNNNNSNSLGDIPMDPRDVRKREYISPLKSKNCHSNNSREGSFSLLDLEVIQELLDTVITKQQVFFKELLDAVDRKEQLIEQMRYEREEKWRAEERAQRYAFNNAMIVLTQRLLGEKPPIGMNTTVISPTNTTATTTSSPPIMAMTTNGLLLNPKKRSKNWKKSEVFTLIKLRRDMESRFLQSTRRAGLWEEMGEKLASMGIQRDGKQCREKWDKLMAEYKDVIDGRKDKEESPYFKELSTFMKKVKETEEANSSLDVMTLHNKKEPEEVVAVETSYPIS